MALDKTGLEAGADMVPRGLASAGTPSLPSPAAPPDPSALPTPEPKPIDNLGPETDLQKVVLEKLLNRIHMSEREISKFYPRWRMSEKKMQAHIDLPEYEQLLKAMATKDKTPPPLVSLTVPYGFATIWTIVTYLIHTFAGRKPMFQIGANKAETVRSAENLETVLQYNADHMRLVKELFQYLLDGELYGVGIVRTLWSEEKRWRRRWVEAPIGGSLLGPTPGTRVQTKELRTVYEGNACRAIDPFMFFPDPRVPMSRVARDGEFVFWRTFEGTHKIKKAEALGELKWVEAAKTTLPRSSNSSGSSARNILSQGSAHAGAEQLNFSKAEPIYQVDQGTVELIPKDWGLSESGAVEKWIFTILNQSQIVQAEPLDLDHDMHPVACIEPYSFGYGFGQVGLMDMTAPLQDTISWFINSHIHNVRGSLNNSFLVNPAAIEMQDLKTNKAGKLIRLKPAYYGVDVRTVLTQMNVHDVTQGHVNDVQNFMRMADSLSAVNDNLRGLNTVGGRKTATEVRTSGDAGASRLAAHAKLISVQGIVDLTEQMSLNLQQNMSEDFYTQITGQEGAEDSIIRPEDIVGDFTYPIHDGTLPVDKIATLDIWRSIMEGVLQDPQLRSEFDVGKIFEFVAELGGARNIASFKLAKPEQLQAGVQAGNTVPIQQLAGGGGGLPPQLAALMQGLGGGK